MKALRRPALDTPSGAAADLSSLAAWAIKCLSGSSQIKLTNDAFAARPVCFGITAGGAKTKHATVQVTKCSNPTAVEAGKQPDIRPDANKEQG